MLTSLPRAWHIYSESKERTALANHVDRHLARDIGVDGTRVPRVLHTLWSR
jgi:hypothetical protein